MVVTLSVPEKANSGVRACVPAAGKVLEGDDKPTLLREDQHYLHYITITLSESLGRLGQNGGGGHIFNWGAAPWPTRRTAPVFLHCWLGVRKNIQHVKKLATTINKSSLLKHWG